MSLIPVQPNLSAIKIKSSVGQGQTIEQSLKGQNTVVIGRGKDCDVVIEDIKASGKHCKLTRQKDAFLLEDLASKNGTYVYGSRISTLVILKKNQTFKIGDTVFYLAS
ncbi:MAG: FHA domain-containing protein [Verrucomicrobiales bacterium]